MANASIVVLDGYTLNPGDLSWDGLHALGSAVVYDRTPPSLVRERAANANCVLTNKTPLDARTLAELPALKYIGVLATGYNIVDVAAAHQRGIVVSNVPTYGTAAVAQHTFALILELANRVSSHSQAVAAGEWSRGGEWCLPVTPMAELAGRTLGIVGLGRVGSAVARIAHSLGMTVIAHGGRHFSGPADGLVVAQKALAEVFSSADIVSLHCPLTPQTERLVDATRLQTMKPSAWLINTSRGQLVDSQALADALRAGTIAAAATDVLDCEPPPPDHPLLHAPHCLVTPHVAWYALQSRQRLLETAIANLKSFLAGTPQHVVGR